MPGDIKLELSGYEASNLRWLLRWAWAHRAEHPELNNGDWIGSVPIVLAEASKNYILPPSNGEMAGIDFVSPWDESR